MGDSNLVNSFQAHNNSTRSLDFSPHTDFMLLTSDADELVFWDLRNLNKRLFTAKSSNLNDAEFYRAKGGCVLMSRQNNVELLDLARYREGEADDKNGVSVSSLVPVPGAHLPRRAISAEPLRQREPDCFKGRNVQHRTILGNIFWFFRELT